MNPHYGAFACHVMHHNEACMHISASNYAIFYCFKAGTLLA